VSNLHFDRRQNTFEPKSERKRIMIGCVSGSPETGQCYSSVFGVAIGCDHHTSV